MAQRQSGGLPYRQPSSSAAYATATAVPAASAGDSMLRNFRQEDIVNALMTQLREKESQITLLSEQGKVLFNQQQITERTNLQLKAKIDLHNKAVAAKDTKIALLEQQLAQEKRGNGSHIAEANLKHLTQTNAECKRILQERDDELSALRPVVREMKAKIEDYERKENVQRAGELEEELDNVKSELAAANDKNCELDNTIEQLEKKVKGKEWMVKSLQEENDDQRSRENHLLAHIKRLNDQIQTYESKFKGTGVDVPMLLAKLKDYEVRTTDLQGQIRRLTNKKLNELVLRSSPVPNEEESKDKKAVVASKPQEDEVDNESIASENSSFVEQDDEEDTLGTNGTDEDMFSPKSEQDEDVLSDFLTDVKAGIETLEMESLCCAQRSSPTYMASPTYRDPRSPISHGTQ